MFVPILAYHKVQNQAELGVSNTSPKQFERQIKYLCQNGFKSTSIEDYVKGRSFGDKHVIITFDDAYTSVFENAFPILDKYNFKATIFVITKFVGEYNSWDYHFKKFRITHCDWEQIKELRNKGWEVGSHTVSHPNLKKISSRKLWFEIRYSKEVIENYLNSEVTTISYPFGSYNGETIDVVRSSGYEAACTLGHNYPYNENFPFALFRRGVYCFEPMRVFKLKLSNNSFAHVDDIRQKAFSWISQKGMLLQALKSN